MEVWRYEVYLSLNHSLYPSLSPSLARSLYTALHCTSPCYPHVPTRVQIQLSGSHSLSPISHVEVVDGTNANSFIVLLDTQDGRMVSDESDGRRVVVGEW